MIEVSFWEDLQSSSGRRERAWEVIEELRGGVSWTDELVARRKGGSLFDVQLSASSVTDETGEPTCMMASFLDITEHKRAEGALRESEERYRNFVESARDVIHAVSLDSSITSLNPAFETMTGWSCTEWIGKPSTPISEKQAGGTDKVKTL